ncbi:FAD-dependent oxidoreductase [Streptosporangium canum]|uniref:FAD-dependent oxidoreductase n=1 Tax=Streptosporangium canum TaxID=324952 RepID=UPI0037B4EEED
MDPAYRCGYSVPMDSNSVSTQDVLIVGGGTVGLGAAVFLAHHGVRALVVEREPGPQVHPRATGIGARHLPRSPTRSPPAGCSSWATPPTPCRRWAPSG